MSEIGALCKEWMQAKADEAKANKRRVQLEEQIVTLVGKRDEGAQTVEKDGFKITTTGKVSRKFDWAKWETIKDQIPELLRPIKTKLELDEAGVKYLLANEPAIYALLPLTATPGKTAVDVRLLEVAE